VLCALHNTEVSYRRWLVKPLEFQTETVHNSCLGIQVMAPQPCSQQAVDLVPHECNFWGGVFEAGKCIDLNRQFQHLD
jgi:hypothetical protein